MSKNKQGNPKIINVVEEVVEEVPAVEEITVAEPIIKHVKGGNLNVRKFPRVGDNIVRVLSDGAEVTVYEEIDGWARISEEQSEYVMTEFLG